MAWIESHQTLADHPKTRKLAHLLGVSVPAAIGHLHCLWWWALDYSDDGSLAGHDALDIAIGAKWDGDADELVDALIRVGFIDVSDAGLSIHDWYDYGGKLTSRRKANTERMRKARAEQNPTRAAHVQRTNSARVKHVQNCAELQYTTQEDTTQEDTTGESDGANAPAPPAKTNPRGSRISDDFTVTVAMGLWAVEEGMTNEQIQRETEKFVDYWRTVPGAKGRKLDWQLTWKNWIRRTLEDRPRQNGLSVVGGDYRPKPAYYDRYGNYTSEGLAARARGEKI